MYLLLRTQHVGDSGNAYAWTGDAWSVSPVDAMRMDRAEDWRRYCIDHGLAGDIVRAEIVIHEHHGWTSGIPPATT